MNFGVLLGDVFASLPWGTLGTAIVSFIVGITVAIVSPGLRSTVGALSARLQRSATLLVWPVAHKRPRLRLDADSITCTRHLEKDGTVSGYSLRLKCAAKNRGKGTVAISRNAIAARLTSNDDRRKSITFDGHPFTHSLLGPGDNGADMPDIRIEPKQHRLLDLGLVTYWNTLEDLPGARLNGQLAMRFDLAPRAGRDVHRYRDALHPVVTIPFSLQSRDIVEEVGNWLDAKVALAREVGASEDDIRDRLLPRWPDDDELKTISPF